MERPRTKQLVTKRYKDYSGNPFELADGQAEIFEIIATRGLGFNKPDGSKYNRFHCMAFTQYGKSEAVSMAVLTRVTNYAEKWALVAPSTKKAGIIMGYVIQHVFDNDYCMAKFEIEEGEKIEHIRRSRSKDRMTFKHTDGRIGEVFILSAEGKRTKDLMDALLGFGSPNVVVDESSLMDDVQHTGILRMLGGTDDNFLFEIGNPMRRNHFLRSSRDPNYYHLNIDYKQGLKEGRITPDFVNEMMKEPLFAQLYENKFPDEDALDRDGYSQLISEGDIMTRMRDNVQLFGRAKLGCDVAGEGSNFSVIVKRSKNGAEILYKEHNPDLMNFTGVIMRTAKEHEIEGQDIYVDATGIGKGVVDRLHEIEDFKDVTGVISGAKADDPELYINKRAEMFWRLREWLGKAELPKDDWRDLMDIRYKVQSDKRIKIKSKGDMLKVGVLSPDVADALSYTFYEPDEAGGRPYKQKPYEPQTEYGG